MKIGQLDCHVVVILPCFLYLIQVLQICGMRQEEYTENVKNVFMVLQWPVYILQIPVENIIIQLGAAD